MTTAIHGRDKIHDLPIVYYDLFTILDLDHDNGI